MKIRLHGTAAECSAVAGRLGELVDVVSVSGAYPDRGASVLVRVYVEARLRDPRAEAAPSGLVDLGRAAARVFGEPR